MTDRDRNEREIEAAVARLARNVAPPLDLWPRILEAIENTDDGDADRLTRALPTDVAPPEYVWPRIERHISSTARSDLAPAVPSAQPRSPEAAVPWSARGAAARVWGAAGLGVAATLVLGIFIGRWTAGVGPAVPSSVTAGARTTVGASRLPLPSEIAASEHLHEAETLLLLFESAPATGSELADSAEVLAARTRLLIDSHVGEDPEARSILLDLEYFLTQISRLEDTPNPTERELTRESLEGSTIVARLRELSRRTSRAGEI